jgi:hypothetical protein
MSYLNDPELPRHSKRAGKHARRLEISCSGNADSVNLQWLPQLLDRLPDKLIESAIGPGMAKINEMKRVSLGTLEYYSFTYVS